MSWLPSLKGEKQHILELMKYGTGGLGGSYNVPETSEWQSWGVSPGITNSTSNLAGISPYGGGRICQVLGKPGGMGPKLLSMY